TLNQQTGALTDNTRAWVAHKLEQDGVLKRAEQLGLDLATVTDAVLADAAPAAEQDRVLDDNEITTLGAARAAEEYRQLPLEHAGQLGLDLATVTDAVMGDAGATAELNRVLDDNEITTLDAARAAEEYRQRLLEQGVSSREAALQTTLYHMELKAQARASRET